MRRDCNKQNNEIIQKENEKQRKIWESGRNRSFNCFNLVMATSNFWNVCALVFCTFLRLRRWVNTDHDKISDFNLKVKLGQLPYQNGAKANAESKTKAALVILRQSNITGFYWLLAWHHKVYTSFQSRNPGATPLLPLSKALLAILLIPIKNLLRLQRISRASDMILFETVW